MCVSVRVIEEISWIEFVISLKYILATRKKATERRLVARETKELFARDILIVVVVGHSKN